MEKINKALEVCSKNDFVFAVFCDECPYNHNGCSEALCNDIAQKMELPDAKRLFDCSIEQLIKVVKTGVIPPMPKKCKKDTYPQTYISRRKCI